MDEMSDKLNKTGYMSPFIAHTLNLKYKDFQAIKNKEATIKEEDISKMTQRVKMLLTNTECYTLNQRNMLIKAKGLIYTGGLYTKLSHISYETIEDYTGWSLLTTMEALDKIKQDKGKSIYSLGDNDILVLYSLYCHSGAYNEVIYNSEEPINISEFEALRDYFIENNVGDFLYNLGYKTKANMAKVLNISVSKLNNILKVADMTNTTRNKNLLQDIYNKINGNAIHKRKSKGPQKTRTNYKIVKYTDLTQEEKDWYKNFDFNSILDNRPGFKATSTIQMLNKLGFSEGYLQTWRNLAKHLTDYGNFILVRSLYNYVVNNTIINVNRDLDIEDTLAEEEEPIDIIEEPKEVSYIEYLSGIVKKEEVELILLRKIKAIRDEAKELKKELGNI